MSMGNQIGRKSPNIIGDKRELGKMVIISDANQERDASGKWCDGGGELAEELA
jgi:hypothetical protein